MAEIDTLLTGDPQLVSPHSLVLAGNGWHPGIPDQKAAKVIYRYNHSQYYVNTVLKIAKELKG